MTEIPLRYLINRTNTTKMESEKITIKEGLLYRDNRPLCCPYATRILVPGRMSGTAEINQGVCNTSCSLMQISKENITLCNGRMIDPNYDTTEIKSSLIH